MIYTPAKCANYIASSSYLVNSFVAKNMLLVQSSHIRLQRLKYTSLLNTEALRPDVGGISKGMDSFNNLLHGRPMKTIKLIGSLSSLRFAIQTANMERSILNFLTVSCFRKLTKDVVFLLSRTFCYLWSTILAERFQTWHTKFLFAAHILFLATLFIYDYNNI